MYRVQTRIRTRTHDARKHARTRTHTYTRARARTHTHTRAQGLSSLATEPGQLDNQLQELLGLACPLLPQLSSRCAGDSCWAWHAHCYPN